MTDSCTVFRIGVNLHLTLVNNCLKLVLYLCVQNFAQMFCPETCCKSIFADTDTDHITLSGMHYTFDAVQVAVEFTLEYRLEVGLHALSCNLYHICDAVFASNFEFVEVRSDHFDLVIFYLRHIFGLYQLTAVYTGTVEFYLHIAAADDLAFKCGRERNRNVDVCDLDLNIACFQRSRVEFADVFLDDQALRNRRNILVIVGDYREAKCDRACSACNDHVIQRLKCIDECRYTVFCISHQRACIARSDVSEDQRCTDRYRNYMDHRSNVLAQRDHADICACLVAQFLALIDDTAYQCYQDTLCLIALHQIYAFLRARSGTKDNCNTRDIAGYQRHTKLTDHCVAQMSVARLFVWLCAVDVFDRLDKLCAECSCNTGHKYVVQFVFSGHQRFYNAERFLQFFQVCYFCSCYRIIAGQSVRGVRKADRFLFAVLRDCSIDCSFRQTIYGVISAKNSLE